MTWNKQIDPATDWNKQDDSATDWDRIDNIILLVVDGVYLQVDSVDIYILGNYVSWHKEDL